MTSWRLWKLAAKLDSTEARDLQFLWKLVLEMIKGFDNLSCQTSLLLFYFWFPFYGAVAEWLRKRLQIVFTPVRIRSAPPELSTNKTRFPRTTQMAIAASQLRH